MKSSLLGATAILVGVAATFACSTPAVVKRETATNDVTEPAPRKADAGVRQTEPKSCPDRAPTACLTCCEEAAPSLQAVRKAYRECLCQPSVCKNECAKTRCSATPPEDMPMAPIASEADDPCTTCEYGTTSLEGDGPSAAAGAGSQCLAVADKLANDDELKVYDRCIASCGVNAPGADATEDADGGTASGGSGGGGS